MKYRQGRWAGSLVILWLLIPTAAAQTTAARLDRFFSALHKAQRFNGVVLVADKGRVVYGDAFGYAQFETKRRNALSSPFPIASITKTSPRRPSSNCGKRANFSWTTQ